MQNFFQIYSVIFFALTALIGFLAGCIIHSLSFLIPEILQYQWRMQSWQYLYPQSNAVAEIVDHQKIKTTKQKFSILSAFLAALLSICVAYRFGPHWKTSINLMLMWGFLLLAYIDYKTHLLPDCLTLPLLWLGLFCNTFELFVPLHKAVWGAMIGYLSLWLIAMIFKYCRNKEGIGQGDFKLLAVFGAWWGFYPLPFIVMFASTLGASIALIQIARGYHQLQKPLAFGPYLILGSLIVMMFNQKI